MKNIIIALIIIAVVILAVFKLISNRDKNTKQTEVLSGNKVAVTTADVEKINASFTLEFTGTSYPDKELDIAAETAGKLASVNFELGQHLQPGGILATIDDKIKKLAYESAKIDAEKLKKDYVRTENLYKGGTASEQELDKAKQSYETAANKVEECEKQIAYTKITTSIPGIVTKKNVEKGSYVNNGTIIASIVDISKLKIKMNISENNVYYLETGNTVKITTNVYPGMEFSGKIKYISPNTNEAHNYQVEAEMANSTKNPIKAGTFVTVNSTIKTGKDGLFIPREALLGSINDAKVYVVEEGKARIHKITVGRQSEDKLEVISGLSEQDKVITSGQVNLADNKPIKIINN